MPDNNRRKALYDQLTKDGYDLGNYDSFSMNLDNEKNRKNLYDAITADNYDVGDYDSFSAKLNGGTEVDSMGVSSSPISVVDRMTELMREQDNVKKPDKTLRDIVSETPVRTERNLLDKMPISKESAYSVKSEDRNYRTGIPERMKYDTSIRDEDAEVNRQYSPKVEKREEDVFENYRNRFGLTQRGIELQEELAGIQGEIQDKYFKEFEKTPEYAAITGKGYKTQEEADAANNALNDLYIRMYGDIINKEMEPYMKAYEGEMVKRYAPRIQQGLETIAKRNTAEEVGKLVGEVEDLIDKQKNILRSKGPSSGNAMNALMGSRNYIQSTEKERKEMGALEASQRLLEKSQEIIEEAGKKGNTNFFAGLGRGFRDNMDIENFTFGLAEMADAKYLNAALEKAEKGEKLSPAEEKLLEASVVNMATYGYFSSDLGRGYGAGQMTAVSLPFMLEFIANPISGSGNAIAKGLLKYGLKKFGRSSAEKGVLNALGRGITSKAGKFSGRLIGDAAAAAGMEGTTGIGRVASGTLQRLNQNYDYNIGDDGNVHVKKVGDTSMLEALGKSAASTFLENQSEMVFNAFGNFTPLFKGISNVLPGGMNKFMDYVKNSRLGTLYRDMKSNPLLKEMAERTQFRGFGEEYLEEVYNNLMNVPLGEMTMEEVVDLDNNIDIALGLLPTSAFFSMMGLGSMASQRYSSNRRMKKILEDMTPEQQRKMMELTRMSKERGNEDIREFIKITIADNELTPEEKKAEMEYAFELAKQNGIEELREEQDPEEREADDAYIQGAEMPVEERYAANTELEASEEALSALDPAVTDMIDRLASENASTSEVEEVLSGMDEQTAASARDYYNKLQQIKGIVDSARDDAQEVGDAFEAGLEKAIVTDENGNRTVTTAKLMNLIGEEMAQVMVVSDNGNDAVVMMDDGSKKIVKSKMLKDVQTMPADDVVNAYRENVERQAKERTSFTLENHPKTRMPEPGMQIWNGDIPLVIRSVSEDGTVQAFPAVYNDKTGELEIKNGSAPVDMTIRESLALQNDYYNKMDVASKGNNVSEIEAKNASSPEVGENKVSDKILSDGRRAVMTNTDGKEVSYNVLDRDGKMVDSGAMTMEKFSSLQDYVPEKENIPYEQEGSGLSDEDATSLMEAMEKDASEIPQIELNPANWEMQFGENGRVSTPIGEVKMGENQIAKLFEKGRSEQFGMIKPTLETPHAVIEVASEDANGSPERNSSYLFIRAFTGKDGKKTYYFKSVTVHKDGLEVSISSHFDRPKRVKEALKKGKLLYRFDGGAQTEHRPADVSVTTSPELEQGISESKDSKPFDEKQEGNVNNLIPVDEKGNPIYHKAPLEATVADLMDGTLTDEEVDGFVEANQKEAKEELKKITGKAPKIGTNKAKYISDKNAWQTKVDETQAKVDYWSQVQNAIKEGRMKPGDRTAEEIRAMGEPVNGNELAAQMLAYGQLPLIREDYMRETGFGENEASGMFGLFRTKDNGGMSIEKAGEKLMLADLESGTGFFDQNDANAGRNALLDVLSSVRTRSGLTDYIKNNREAMAERERLAEQKYEEAQLEAWAQENFGMSYADYVTYEDVIDEIIKEKAIPEDVIQDFYNNFAEELNNINNGRIAEDVALDERRTDSSGSENREGLLSSEQFGDNRGAETDTSTEVDGRVDNESVPAQEEAGKTEIEVDKQGNPINKEEKGEEIVTQHADDKLSAWYGTSSEAPIPAEINGMKRERIFRAAVNAYTKGSQLYSWEVMTKFGRPEEWRSLTYEEFAEIFKDTGMIGSQTYREVEAFLPQMFEYLRYMNERALDKNVGKEGNTIQGTIEAARAEVDTNPTDAQKEAGNYKKGHVSVDGYDITIENPKGSERSGTDANGKRWSVTMNNDYGYIRGTKGVDGDHIDVFLSDNPTQGNVYVVDQLDTETGKFDEHKVMYGFSSMEEATAAYLANYSPGWQGIGAISEVSKEEFKKWIDSSHRKTKPFIEYKSVKVDAAQSESPSTDFKYSSFEEYESDRKERLEKSELESAYESILPIVVKYNLIGTPTAKQWKAAQIEAGHKRVYAGRYYLDLFVSELRNGTNPETQSRYDKLKPVKGETAQSGAQTSAKPTETESVPVSQKKDQSGNRLVTDERYAELRERMRRKLGGQMNMGIDPEILAIGTEMAVYHLEKGARKFAEYAKAMIDDLGDVIRPYLKSFYNGARNLPEVENSDIYSDMTPYEEVRTFDVANFDKPVADVIATAETTVREAEVEKEAKVAQEIIQQSRPTKQGNGRRKSAKKSVSLQEESVHDLFNQNLQEDEQRNQTENRSLGERAREEDRGTGSRGEGSGVHGRDVSDPYGSRGIHGGTGTERTLATKQNARNFHFGKEGINVPVGEISKLKANVEAIRTLKELQESGMSANQEQKAKLSRYVGWGGLANALDENEYRRQKAYLDRYGDKNTYYTPWGEKYYKYHDELKQLLTPEEFRSAVESTTTSHYTPEEIIQSLWKIVQRAGFKGGTISEPALGIGHILGFMPESISDNSRISGFELDKLSGRISSALYPDARIKVQGYETEFTPKSKDLVITNVPFAKEAPYDKALDKAFRKQLGSSYNLHNYFILKSLLELKEGGLGVFVTSSATMDGVDSRFREYVSGNGIDLVGAIRLPNNAFLKNAGTSVTADILVFRKRKAGEPSNGIRFTSTTQIGEGSYQENGEKRTKPIMVNEYFAEHPDMMLGDMMTAYDAGSGGLYSGASQTLKAKAGIELGKELSEAVGRLPENILESRTAEDLSLQREQTDMKDGQLITKDGNVFVSEKGELSPVSAKDFKYNGKTRRVADAVNEYNGIKSTLKELIAEEQKADGKPEPLRKKLNGLYDDFVSKYGTLNRNKALDDVFSEDVEHNLPLSLETVKRVPSPSGKSMVYVVEKAKGILSKRISYPVKEPEKADSLQDAINISQSYRGSMDIPYISQLLGISREETTDRLLEDGVAYRDPITGELQDKDSYLSGNVREKLEVAIAAAEGNPEYRKNVEDLTEVQPETVRFGDISFRLGTPWIPTEHVDKFAEDVLGISNADVSYMPLLNEFTLGRGARVTDFAKSGLFNTERMGVVDLFDAAINQRKPKIYDERTEYGPTGKITVRIPNEAETQAAAEKIMEMTDKFIEYIENRKDIHRELERIYNDRYNNYRLKEYRLPAFAKVEKDKDGKEETIIHYPNSNNEISLREHQAKAVQRSLGESTLLAHQVGTGKTFTMITTAMEMRRLGIANKPMIVVQNATLEDFVRDFYKLYPGANVLAPSKDERSAENRKRLFNLIATGDFDAIVIPQSFLQFIPDNEGRKKQLIQKRIDELEEVLSNVEEYGLKKRIEREIEGLRDSFEGVENKKRKVKDQAKAAARIKAKMERQLDRRTDEVMTFEQMGIDALFIDEAHNFKKIGFASKMNNVKGVDTGASQRANSLLLKAKWVQEKNGGRNVILATGTPITNTMAEVWTMMNFIAPEILDSYQINSFDDFATTFGTVEPSLEFTATGNFKIADRFKSYVNVPELIKAFRSHTDVVLTEDVKEFKENNNIPKLKDGKMTNVVINKNEDLEDVMQTLINRLEEYNHMTGEEKRKWSALPLVVFTKAKQAAIDLRLLNPLYPDNPNSKTNQVVGNIIKLYKESTPDKGTQLVFCDSYQSPGEQPKMDLFDYDPDVPRFNLYEDIRDKLIAQGIPANEIAIVNNYDGERRKTLFEKVRNGDVRVLLGSTEKMGVGVNVQDRLYALHHIDAPIRPMDFEQRNGRILRQGNLHAVWGKPVNVVTYGVQGTLDATAYDRLRIKQAFINQMMKGNVSGRVMEEQDEDDPSGMTFSQMAATLSGDKTAQLLFAAQNKLKRLRNLKRSDANSKSAMGDAIESAQNRIILLESKKRVYERAYSTVEKYFPEGVTDVNVDGRFLTEKIGTDLDEIISAYDEKYSLNRGIAPLKMSLNQGNAEVVVHYNEGKMVYELYAGGEHVVEGRQFNGGKGLMSSIEHQLKATKKNFDETNTSIEELHKRIAGLTKAMNAPWGREEELREAEREVDNLQKQLEEKAAENSKKKEDVLYRSDDEVNRKFNEELEQQINGNLPKGHVYQLGRPSEALQSAGLPYLPIELAASRLSDKSMQENHPFELSEVENLPEAIQNPLAVFRSATHIGSFVVMTEIEHKGKNFVVAIQANKKKGRIEINDIRSVHYRTTNAHMANWITEGLLEYVDKKRMAEWLSKQQYNSAEVRKQFNHATKIVESFENPNVSEENMREGAGSYTDRELSEANDPIAKMLGRSTRTTKKQREFAERERKRMTSHVEKLAKRLNLDNVEIVTDASTLEGKKQLAKGFYSKNTGKITIVIPNNANTFDVEQTLLHEAVAHYGLRELFGEQFDMFLDNVFVNAEPEVRGRIVEIAERNGWDFRKATEEYLAELAENTNFENAHKSGWWQKIKDFFLDMLHRIGFEGFSGVTLTDNELRYVLWRSYENLTEPGRHRSIFGEAADVVKQRELKVGEYAESNVRQNNAAEGKNVAEGREVREPEEDEMFRMVGGIFDHAGNDVEVVERETGNARDMYERTLQTAGYKMREAWQDSMLGLKELQNAIAKATNSRILDYENAYMAENALSSRSLAEMNAYRELVYKPLLEEIAKIKKNGIGYDEVSDYLITKHGIERNREMAVRKALAEDEETVKNNIERWTADKKAVWADDNLTWREKQEKLDEIAESYGANLGVDYSGLSSMFEHEDMADTTKEAYDTVERFEDTVDPSALWAKVKAATDATLEKQRDSGLMNSDTFDSIQDMYQYYVPLRGWKETTADEVYDYLTSETPVFNAPLKTAKGRTSKADDPIPTIANIAESGILQGNRNLMKQKFLLMAENHRSDLISVNELWVEYDKVKDEWNAVFPDIPENASSDEVESIVSQFNDRMKELSESNPDKYKKASDAKNIPYKILPNNLREHQVIVKRGGKEYVLTVNGNPRAAQALNGLTNPNAASGPVFKFFEHVNRFLATNFTQRNPAFVISNMFRDGFYSNSTVWVKESPVYAAKFNRNWAKSLKEMGGLVRRYKNNSLDMSNDTDRMFFEFINNGGETGYTFIHSVEDYKGIIVKELKKANRGKLSPAKAFDVLGDAMDTFGRWAEDTSRFAAYRTSREMGRSIAQSVSDAKEISVNFNKKGAGAKTSGKWEKGNRMNALQAWVSQLARWFYIFWNAGVQGLTNFARLAKHNPRKFAGIAASYFVLGGMMPVINAALASALGGDGDEDDYYNLPEYVRRNNICIYFGGEWITIPLPIELRAIYGLGELACGLLSGKESMSGWKVTKKIAEQISQIMPIDIMEGSGGLSAFIPSYFKPVVEAYGTNKDWTGIPIYRDNDFNKNMPEWTKAYSSTSPELVKLSEMMNEWTGGTKYKSGMIDFNPARVEHLFESYLGGVGTTINQLKKTVMMPFDEDLQEMRNAPVISRFMRSADSRSVQKRINEEYFNNRDRFDLIRQEINGYKKELKNPKIDVMDYAKYQDLYNKMIRSDEYRKYVEFTEMQKTLNKMMEVFKQTGDEELEKQMFVLKEAMNEVAK